MSHNSIIRSISKIMVILILLFNILTLSGCENTNISNAYICEGQPLFNRNYPAIQMVVGYDTNIFNKNNIAFNLAYATHSSDDPKSREYEPYYKNEMYFALYISPYDNVISDYFIPFKEYEDDGISLEEIKSIDNFIFVKGMKEEEAFSKEYLYKHTLFKDFYNHVENVTIPWDYVKKCNNKIRIILIAFYYSDSCSGFRIACDCQINIYVKEINESQVVLKFEG